tara:strand:- start:655 stop:957 length:303 start_codon:yes stop_codon:yes gene_type:complete
MTKKIRYEWVYIDLDQHGDIQNLDITDTFAKASNESMEINDDWASKTVCLQKTYLDGNGYPVDNTRAYYNSGWLDEDFEDATPVPKTYIKEVNQWFKLNS